MKIALGVSAPGLSQDWEPGARPAFRCRVASEDSLNAWRRHGWLEDGRACDEQPTFSPTIYT